MCNIELAYLNKSVLRQIVRSLVGLPFGPIVSVPPCRQCRVSVPRRYIDTVSLLWLSKFASDTPFFRSSWSLAVCGSGFVAGVAFNFGSGLSLTCAFLFACICCVTDYIRYFFFFFTLLAGKYAGFGAFCLLLLAFRLRPPFWTRTFLFYLPTQIFCITVVLNLYFCNIFCTVREGIIFLFRFAQFACWPILMWIRFLAFRNAAEQVLSAPKESSEKMATESVEELEAKYKPWYEEAGKSNWEFSQMFGEEDSDSELSGSDSEDGAWLILSSYL